ncbi:MAG: class V aminotransferase [Pseudomonadota bacterium]
MSWKRLFSRALAAAPDRLHFAAHSHHLWPDAAYDGQLEAVDWAMRLADDKWEPILGDLWSEAQRHVAEELALPDPSTVVFAPNTHEFLMRLLSAAERRPVRVLSSDGEFHSFRRQIARSVEAGDVVLEAVPTEPFVSFAERFLDAAGRTDADIVFVSQRFFGTGRRFDRYREVAAAAPADAIVVIDGYHGFMAEETDLSEIAGRAFYTAGGYKYAMSGEGVCFLHCPPGVAERPVFTGWYAEFEDLSLPPGAVGYAPDARRFLGSTFDPSGLFRFAHVRRALGEAGATTAAVSAHTRTLQSQFLDAVAAGRAGALADAELLNPPTDRDAARFLAFRHPHAARWKAALRTADVVTDVRGDVLRIGFGAYQDERDVERLLDRAGEAIN